MKGTLVTTRRLQGTDGTRILTTYFRKSFTATNVSSLTNLEVRVLRDDGAIVYLNGAEVFRSNLGSGPVGPATTAVTTIANAQELQWVSTNINPALLVEGANLLAAEIHQSGTTSTDVSFDLALCALRFDPPTISVVRIGDKFTVTWPDLPPGFGLEMANVLARDPWTRITNSLVTVPGVRSSLTITNQGSGDVFFRLRKN
jgi:hypothetical protein